MAKHVIAPVDELPPGSRKFLTIDDRPIAAAITLFSGDRAWFWKTAYDEEHARCSPGVQLALDVPVNVLRP